MGECFYISCTDCKITRHLNKFRYINYPAPKLKNMRDVKNYELYLQDKQYYSALTISFMFEHITHNCILWNESNDECLEKYCADIDECDDNKKFYNNDYKEEVDFFFQE